MSDPEHFPIPETEEPASSSSAAAAAAAAAVAAVSAAIAATAAANGSRVSEAPATLAEPAPPAAPPPPAEPAQPAMPARPPVTVQGYVRPPGIDVPGLTRAHHDDEDAASHAPGSPPLAPAALAAPAGDVPGIVRAGEPGGEPAAPVVAPLFSNEGIVRGQKAARAGRRSRALGPVAGVSEALTAARDALGHDANPPRSPAESSPDGSGSVAVGDTGPAAASVATSAAAVASSASSAVAAPAAAADLPPGDSASGTRIPHALSHFGDSTLFAWIATGVLAVRVAAAWIGAALAAVLLPVAGALGRLVSAPFRPVADWLRARDSELPEFDDYGYPRQPRVARRRAAGAMIFVGFFGIIFLGIALAAALPPVPATIAASTTPGSSAMAVAPSDSAPGLTSTSERAGRGDRDADSSRGRDRKPHRGSDSGPHRGSDREAHSQADSEADSQADSETHPQPPRPAPVVPVTPAPVIPAPPTPVVTPAPTALPANPVLSVVQDPPVLAVRTNATFWVQYIPGASCYLTRTYIPGATPHPSPTPRTPVKSTSFAIGADGWSGPVPWGKSAQSGTYTITATCTPSGGSATTSPGISVMWQ